MKLFPLLFLNEGQEVFGSNAELQGFVCLKIPNEEMIVIFNPESFMAAYEQNNDSEMAAAVRGYIRYRIEDYVQPSWACSEKGWGPLLYQALMKFVSPKWLMSDESLSGNAAKVYNAMYKLPNLYNRKWVGNISSRYECLQTNEIPQLQNYPEDEIENEEQFLQYLQRVGVDPSQTGCFWAYKKKTHEPAIIDMFKAGNKFASQQGLDVVEKLADICKTTFNSTQECQTR